MKYNNNHSKPHESFAKFSGFENVVKLLLENGVDVNVKDRNGDSAFIKALENGKLFTARK